ncbi:MAG: hypothetical protein ACU0AZ_00005 [Paracoccaceae bacterium]
MTRVAAKTTDGPASIVALEQLFPAGKRLLDDDLILRVAPWRIRIWTILLAPAWLRNVMFRYFEYLTPGAWALFHTKTARRSRPDTSLQPDEPSKRCLSSR